MSYGIACQVPKPDWLILLAGWRVQACPAYLAGQGQDARAMGHRIAGLLAHGQQRIACDQPLAQRMVDRRRGGPQVGWRSTVHWVSSSVARSSVVRRRNKDWA